MLPRHSSRCAIVYLHDGKIVSPETLRRSWAYIERTRHRLVPPGSATPLLLVIGVALTSYPYCQHHQFRQVEAIKAATNLRYSSVSPSSE
jgi:hypothetical protein